MRLDGRLGRGVAIDLCLGCQQIWFDQGESLQLSPASTLRLFRTIGEHTGARRPAGTQEPCCPRCGARLVSTHDRQRNTPFGYRRCDARHGRLISFFDFLREKDFLRPLSKEQLDQLRSNVQTVNCSNCGGAVDLERGSACAHCGSPLSMLDAEQTGRLVQQLQQADRSDRPLDPLLPLRLEQARRQTEAAFAAFEREPGVSVRLDTDLVRGGLAALARWLGRSVR